jgi:hypothetical protein
VLDVARLVVRGRDRQRSSQLGHQRLAIERLTAPARAGRPSSQRTVALLEYFRPSPAAFLSSLTCARRKRTTCCDFDHGCNSFGGRGCATRRTRCRFYPCAAASSTRRSKAGVMPFGSRIQTSIRLSQGSSPRYLRVIDSDPHGSTVVRCGSFTGLFCGRWLA